MFGVFVTHFLPDIVEPQERPLLLSKYKTAHHFIAFSVLVKHAQCELLERGITLLHRTIIALFMLCDHTKLCFDEKMSRLFEQVLVNFPV